MENFKDITEHQLEVGEIGVYEGLTYIALENPSLVDIKCDECDICNICCPDVMCEFDIYLKRHIVTKKEDIDPILESIDDTSDDNSDPVEMITITKSEYEDLLTQSKLNHSRTRWRLMLYCQKRQLNSKYKQSKKRRNELKKQ